MPTPRRAFFTGDPRPPSTRHVPPNLWWQDPAAYLRLLKASPYYEAPRR